MMKYPKIKTMFERDPATKYKTVLDGSYSTPEFRLLKDIDWEFTEKLDGMNTQVSFDGEAITFAGRTETSDIPAVLVNHLVSTFLPKIDTFRSDFIDPIVLFGEGVGGKIKGNDKLYGEDAKFVLFDVYFHNQWLTRAEVGQVAQCLGIPCVNVLAWSKLSDMAEIVRCGANYSVYGNFEAEGIVARPCVELLDADGNRIITKLKRKDFAHNR